MLCREASRSNLCCSPITSPLHTSLHLVYQCRGGLHVWAVWFWERLFSPDGAGETPEHVWNRFKAGTDRVWLFFFFFFFFFQMELRKSTRWKKSLGGSDKLQRKVHLNKHEWQKMEHREAENKKKWGNEKQNGLSGKFTDNNLPLTPPNTDFFFSPPSFLEY